MLGSAITATVGIFTPIVTARISRNGEQTKRASAEQAAQLDRVLARNNEMRSAYETVLDASTDFRAALESCVKDFTGASYHSEILQIHTRATKALAPLEAAAARAALLSDPTAVFDLRRLQLEAREARDNALPFMSNDGSPSEAPIRAYLETEQEVGDALVNALARHVPSAPKEA